MTEIHAAANTVEEAIANSTTVADELTESEHALFIRAILMLSLILVSMNLNGILHKIKFHYLSETAVTILLGVIVAMAWTTISYDTNNADIQLNSDFFYMVLLPPIIFEGGYTLQRVSFFSNILTILSLAFAGALYSTFITSCLMYFFSQFIYPWSFVESLVFGSLISSTDPVTVLSLLPPSVDRRLYMIIFGESALNDAVAIILYRFFTGLADPKMKLGVGPFITSVFASAAVFFGSFLVGIFVALLFAKITKHVKMEEGSVYEMTMLLLFAYISYLLADVLSLTGIISIFFCGIAMAHYAAGNLSEEARKASKISILISRTHVFIILGIKNLLIKHNKDENAAPIPLNQQTLIWFSGLRGAVAFALGVTFLEHPTFDADIKASIFGTTVMVVVLTVLVIGGLTPYMLVWLGISDASDEHEATGEVEGAAENNDDDDDQDEFNEEDFNKNAENKSIFVWLRNFDSTYIRPHFCANDEPVDTFVPKALFPRASLPAELENPKRKSLGSRSRLSESYRSLKKKSMDAGLDGDLGSGGHNFSEAVQKTAEAVIDVPIEEQEEKDTEKFSIE
ncbi:Sodium/hydrogen exchanger 8 [Physocladia obscura]|uniref:Sodium/hydrogen exchanger 8 n=1 Tax=Physocladia obscura TaxID=109957 RepID=A0AAD5XCB6_9FUNG|nr:Sodium/hydrogen exchanger 8 [Physocladia obscura]